MIELAAISDVGCYRANNEDAWDARPALGLFALADGMGGHQAGEVAAHATVSIICRLLEEKLHHPPHSVADRLACLTWAIREANSAVFAKSWEDPSLQGMGTTICLLYWDGPLACYAHVGDSRIYFWNGTSLFKLTQDHTVAAELADAGLADETTAQELRHRLTRAVGTGMTIDASTGSLYASHGVFLLCSDGLTETLSDAELASYFQRDLPLERLAHLLIEEAKRRSHDNITVLLAARDISE